MNYYYNQMRLKYLLVFLHGSIKFLRKVIRNVGHPWFLLVRSAQAAFVLARFLIVLLFGIFAVTFYGLK